VDFSNNIFQIGLELIRLRKITTFKKEMSKLEENFSVSEKMENVKPIKWEMLNKAPQVTIFFWFIMIMVTNVGETAADFLNDNFNFGLMNTTIIISVILIITLYFQFRAKKYVPRIYWLVMVLISLEGTLGSDNLTQNLGLPFEITTIIFFALMVVNFLIWYLSERTFSLHSINTTKREAFYWLAILFSFALGTSAGDWISEVLSLGYFYSAIMFASILGIVAFAHQDYKWKSVLAFWFAHFLTRPFGASLGNFLSKPRHSGGLGLGTTGTSSIFLLTIVILVIYLTKTKKEDSPILG
jgi:uncharacterized membrane-anchored protein